MKCYECGNETIVKNVYHYENEYIGKYDINDCEYEYCEKCGSEYVPLKTALMIEKFENDKKKELLLKNFPIETNEYLTIKEIAESENCTENDIIYNKAFNIWVYNIMINNERMYLKKSYEIHKKTGNVGFFKLYKEM